MKNSLILIPFNAPLNDVCDYAEQTVRYLSKDNTVIGIALSSPLSLFRDFSVFWRGGYLIHRWGARVFRPVMIIPFQRFEPIKRLNFLINIFAINVWLLLVKKQKLLWFFEPKFSSHFLRWLCVNVSLYDCVDYFPAYKEWKREHLFCLKHVSFAVVNSQSLRKQYQSSRKDLKTVPLGFSQEDMLAVKLKIQKKKESPLIFGYIGTVGDRLDFHFLEQLMSRRPKDHFILIGPQEFDPEIPWSVKKKRHFQKILTRKNVQWVSSVSRKKLWKKAQQFDVGLIPYDVNDLFNRYSFPMKIMEYFYAGLPIIATDIEELAPYSKYIFIPQHLGWKKLGKFLHSWTSLQQQAERTIALANTWEKKVAAITVYVEERMRLTKSQV